MSSLERQETESTAQDEAQHERSRLLTTASLLSTTHDHPSKPLPVSFPYEQYRSPLLNLPGEILNRIYQFVLTTSKGIYLDPDQPTRFLEADATVAYEERRTFNLLKFACHRLYKETADLEIQFNRVEFFGRSSNTRFCYPTGRFPRSSGPARAFNAFVSNFSATKANWFREVVLRFNTRAGRGSDSAAEVETELLAVDRFCHIHPHVNVRYVPRDWDASARTAQAFVFAGTYLSLQFRGEDVRDWIQNLGPLSSGQPHALDPISWLRDKDTKFTLSAPNFRFWPMSHVLDQEAFWEDLVTWSSFLRAGVCFELAMNWTVNGI